MFHFIVYLIIRNILLYFINSILHPSSPLGGCLCLIEGLPRNGFADAYHIVLTATAIHFIRQKYHCEVGQVQTFAPMSYVVETVRVLPFKMNRHDVAMVLYTLYYESFVPRLVANGTIILPPATEACGKHEHVVLALEACLDHHGEVAALVAGLVDGDADGDESREVHEQVVDEVAETSVVMSPDDGAKCYAVLAAEGVVADEGVESSVVGIGQVLAAFDLKRHVEIAHAIFKPFYALFVAAFPEEGVHLILMGDALEPTDKKSGHELRLRSHL